MKFAEGWEGHPGWHLDYPFNGNATRKIPKHPMNRWNTNAEAPNIEYITRYGDNITYRDLSNELKTDAVADYFGAVSNKVLEGGVVVCGSISEVSNDPLSHEVFEVRSNEKVVTSSEWSNQQKTTVWVETALNSSDQLRQRMAWALSQIVTVVPQNIDAFDRTETYTLYYDIFGEPKDIPLFECSLCCVCYLTYLLSPMVYA